MILFINPIQNDITFSIIDNSVLIKKIVLPHGDDFLSFPEFIRDITESYSIEEIWCICGPGPFTRMRIITLALNTFHLSKGILLKWCHFFDLINEWTPILEINSTEYIVWDTLWGSKTVNKSEISTWIYTWYISKNDFTDGKVFIEYKEILEEILAYFWKIKEQRSLSPIYYKNPHITCSKKNTSPYLKTMKK